MLAVSLSTFGPPVAAVAVARTRFVPALTFAEKLASCQVVQAPVPGKASAGLTVVPLTEIRIGRLAVVPLAYRIWNATLPAVSAVTDHST
jgi:hypothetical protein